MSGKVIYGTAVAAGLFVAFFTWLISTPTVPFVPGVSFLFAGLLIGMGGISFLWDHMWDKWWQKYRNKVEAPVTPSTPDFVKDLARELRRK